MWVGGRCDLGCEGRGVPSGDWVAGGSHGEVGGDCGDLREFCCGISLSLSLVLVY